MATEMLSFDALVFPCDDRPPHIVSLMTSPLVKPIVNPAEPYRCGRIPHPEVYMDFIAEGLGHQSWRYVVAYRLDGMSKDLKSPYILFYPFLSRDGMPFPVNKCVREVQGSFYRKSEAWRGNIVIAKYLDPNFSQMVEASIADFPIVKNYLSTEPAP